MHKDGVNMLPDGDYKTQHGSTMTISRNGGKSVVEFDFFEESNACCDCQVDAYEYDGYMTWSCDYCGCGRAKLEAI